MTNKHLALIFWGVAITPLVLATIAVIFSSTCNEAQGFIGLLWSLVGLVAGVIAWHGGLVDEDAGL